MDLPDELSPWSSQLALFDPPLALALGESVRRIALAVGPLPSASPRGEMPDGYAGLTRRGPYERLLSSEWALAETLPDEFVRRAVMGEHVFLAPSFRSPGAARRSVALFDAGPMQLGTPRIAQLAALVVLARRAEIASVPFSWGVVQKPKGLLDGLTGASALYLLQARTSRCVDDDALSAWTAALAKVLGDTPDVDLWVVAGAAARSELQKALPRAATLLVEDVLSLDRHVVTVDLRTRTGRAARVELELPETSAAVRLLRDPFRVAAAPRAADAPPIAATSRLVFGADGRRLFARGRSGELVIHYLPNSPMATAPRASRFWPAPDELVLAADGRQKRIDVLTLRGSDLVLHGLGPRGGRHRPDIVVSLPGVERPAVSLDALSQLFVQRDAGPLRALFVDAHDALWATHRLAAPVLARGVVATWQRHGEVAWVREADAGGGMVVEHLGTHADAPTPHPTHRARVPCFFGYAGLYTPAMPGMLASPGAAGWTIWRETDVLSVVPPAGSTVIGVSAPFRHDTEPWLFHVHDERHVSAVSGRTARTRRVTIAPSRITHATLSPYAPHLAYVTESGELTVWDLLREGVILRVGAESR